MSPTRFGRGTPTVRTCRVLGLLALAQAAGCGRVGMELMPAPGQDGGIGGESPGDLCPDDPAKTTPGLCGCGVPDSDLDTDGDGLADCVDACNGVDDANYVPSQCGLGYCEATSTPSSCLDGEETACVPGAPMSAEDATCDGVDDDCDGAIDEDYAGAPTSCGEGVCASSGAVQCVAGQPTDTCTPGNPNNAVDDASWPGNGLDDDCDGAIDEDSVPPCSDTTAKSYDAGSHSLSVPFGCTSVTVQLWGGGGGSGGRSSGDVGTPGRGGSGGFAQDTLTISGALQLHVAAGGRGCGAGGAVTGLTSHNGGAGGEAGTSSAAAGKPGGDGSTAGGGTGAAGATGAFPGRGGLGHLGGGGGAAGGNAPWPPYAGTGGGGGGASTLLMGGARTVLAGGGGGGGAMSGTGAVGLGSAGLGGEGCSGPGGAGASGGGGGGGGICTGTITQRGADGLPANRAAIPAGRAAGGAPTDNNDCINGGAGHAIVTFGN